MKTRNLLFMLGLCTLALPQISAAESTHCTEITALPKSITSSGVYCINKDLDFTATTGNAITILADSVTLDLNGHAIRGNSPASVGAAGIWVDSQKYFTITDGTIAGFGTGIFTDDGSKGGLIADIKVQRSVQFGMLVMCNGCIIRNNMITDTVYPASVANMYQFPGELQALYVNGTGDQVTGNRVYNSIPPSPLIGAAIDILASNSSVTNNYVANDQLLTSSTIYGIHVTGPNVLVMGNQVQNTEFCYWFDPTTTKYGNNLSNGCSEAFGGSGAAGAGNLGGNN